MRMIGRLILVAGLAGIAANPPHAFGQPLQRLRVSPNGRYFVKQDASPFFFLGDTAWGLFHFTREDVDLYLADRAAKKFTVIQAIVAYWGGLDNANAYGQTVFVDKDPNRPNEAYFQHVDYAVNKAESLNLYVAMVPIWSTSYVRQGRSVLDKSSAFSYGKFLATRYRNKPVIWILGGDWLGDGLEDIWRAMAAGMTEGDGGTHLKTYHPTGLKSSSEWFHHDAWLDFNMLQTGHRILNRNYELVASDYALEPPKPIVDGESAYEGITNNLADYKPGVPLIEPKDVRRMAYCALFAGAAGYTYGSHGVWNYRSNGRGDSVWGPDVPLREALDRPGGSQMQYVRNLIESRPVDCVPDQWLLLDDPMSTTERIQACRARDGSYAFVYTAAGRPVHVQLRDKLYDKVSGKTIRVFWYDPRQGTATHAEDFTKPASGDNPRSPALSRTFTPPSSGAGNDWVLVLDDASKNFPAPGGKRQ